LCTYISTLVLIKKQHLTLSIDASLIEQMKIQAVLEKTSVSEITEKLYTTYLSKQTKKGTK